MKRILATIIFISVCGEVDAQGPGKIESLDSFFAGIPLKQSYDKWVKFIVEDSTLGIDSARPRGLYSSFKNNRYSHFPFPDSIPVKILLETGLYIDPEKKIPSDTTRTIMLEGIFENSKKGLESAAAYFRVLLSMLKPYYRKWDGVLDKKTGWQTFWDGKNQNYPEVSLLFDYYDEGNFYFVILSCDFRGIINFKLK